MGIFLSITLDSRYAGNFETNVKQNKVSSYIADNLQDMAWQESISGQVEKIDKHYISLGIVFRLFRKEDIENGKLKSYARYSPKDDRLTIDQILAIDDYKGLSEDEMRRCLCDAIFDYLKDLMIKYCARFQNFDSVAFIPLLKERMERIKNKDFEDDYIESESFAMQKLVEEMKLDRNYGRNI